MSPEDLKQFDKLLELRGVRIIEPSLAGLSEGLRDFWLGMDHLIVTIPDCSEAAVALLGADYLAQRDNGSLLKTSTYNDAPSIRSNHLPSGRAATSASRKGHP